jgi:hypothetical protein
MLLENFINSSAAQYHGTLPPSFKFSCFTNEIHYDNASTDIGEGVKCRYCWNRPGWSIIPYNGNGEYHTSYRKFIRHNPVQSNGFGTVFVTINGFTKWLLTDCIVNNLELPFSFLSYEGFVATNGAAKMIVLILVF